MQYLDNDNEFNIADLSEFIQDTYILDNEIGFDNIGLDDLLDREHNDELILPSEEEGSQKTQSLENIYCFPTEDVSLSRTDSKDEGFLNDVVIKSKCDEHSSKSILTRTVIPKLPDLENPSSNNSKEHKCEQNIISQNNENLELSDEMIKFQFNINKSLESLLKTMKRTKETRYLLHLNSKHNSEVQELNRQQSLDISSWTLSNKRLDSLTINDCSIKNDADYRIDQNISSSITYSKRSGLSFKRRNKKALCKFVGYKHRRNSAS